MQHKILIGSHNLHKIDEFRTLFKGLNLEIQTVDLSETEPAETGKDFAENSLIKARHYSLKYNMQAIADDSGLIIDDLDGLPGLYSARFAAEHGGFPQVLYKIKDMLNNKESKARFICNLCLFESNTSIQWFEGIIEGTIKFTKIMQPGFGYNPIFFPLNSDKSFAELDAEGANKISHRSIAFGKLREYLVSKGSVKG